MDLCRGIDCYVTCNVDAKTFANLSIVAWSMFQLDPFGTDGPNKAIELGTMQYYHIWEWCGASLYL